MLLGDGAEFEGKLSFEGTVRIDARFTGSIITRGVLIVGEPAKVDADIRCGTVIVYGEVRGNIHASQLVELRESARVDGDIETPALLIDRGVVFQGQSRMVGAGLDMQTASGNARTPSVSAVPPMAARAPTGSAQPAGSVA